MTSHNYPSASILVDYAKAMSGLAISLLSLFLFGVSGILNIFLFCIAIIFLLFAIKTFIRNGTTVYLSEEEILVTSILLRKKLLKLHETKGLKLNYYSTRRDRERGWMQLSIYDKKQKISIDSSISNFESIAKKIANMAKKNEITLSNRTINNFRALGISFNSTPGF